MDKEKCLPWKNGYYKLNKINRLLFLVDGEKVTTEKIVGEVDDIHKHGTWTYGEYEEAREEIKDASGKSNYNVELDMWGSHWKTKGVVSDDGTKITVWSISFNGVDYIEKISDEDLKAFREDGDLASAPTNHYKIQPEVNGKLLWISGAPGFGKSTTGFLLSKMADYVYYEGDAFGIHLNPYIPPDTEEPSLACHNQRPLRNVPKDRVDAVNGGIKDLIKMCNFEEYDIESVKTFYSAMCENIKSEKKRMGGNWVVTGGVPLKLLRDHIRKHLGPDLTFVILNMSKDEQRKRVLSRHGEERDKTVDWMVNMFDLFEAACVDEENTIELIVSQEMSREDVVKKLLNMLEGVQ